MDALIDQFSSQLTDALEIGNNASLHPAARPVKNILISGLGGSGIGGKIVSQLVENEATVPIAANNNYFIPSYIDENSLVIISSYSGNTEETLSAMDMAIKSNAQIACVTSGGQVLDKAKELGLNHIVIPGGMPPRACLGYSMVQLFYLLSHYGVIETGFEKDIKAGAQLILEDKKEILENAASIASFLHGKTPVIYCAAQYEGVAIRFRQQLNENSKMLCWHHVFPEMNHNELVGWRKKDDSLAIVIFRDLDDYKKTSRRIDICKDVFKKYTPNIQESWCKGGSSIAKAIYFIHLGDWVSYLLAQKNEVDAMEIDVINMLKSELGKN
jgi:glucose/mannose-6-phosphate isomerase